MYEAEVQSWIKETIPYTFKDGLFSKLTPKLYLTSKVKVYHKQQIITAICKHLVISGLRILKS